jgi:transposase
MKRYTPDEIVKKIREGERLTAEGKSQTEVAKALQVSYPTWNRWQNQYGGIKTEDATRLKELEKENVRLKKLVANLALDNDMLKDIASGKF